MWKNNFYYDRISPDAIIIQDYLNPQMVFLEG